MREEGREEGEWEWKGERKEMGWERAKIDLTETLLCACSLSL